MKTSPSAIGRLLEEISWEGNARHYRKGGQGRENVLTAEIFQLLDFLPRAAFLGSVIRSASGNATTALNILADEIEDASISLLPGDLSPFVASASRSFTVQPDVVIESPSVYCMVEVKRIRRGAFQRLQLAREFLVCLEQAAAQPPKRRPLLLLILPEPPPIYVSRRGRLPVLQAILEPLQEVVRAVPGYTRSFDDTLAAVETTLAFTTWHDIETTVKSGAQLYAKSTDSLRGTIQRLTESAIRTIEWHAPNGA